MATFRDANGDDWRVELDGLLLQDVFDETGIDRQATRTLGELIEAVRKSIAENKPSTQVNFEKCFGNLIKFYGASKHIGDVTPADAEEFRTWLKRCGRHDGGPLATATVSRRCRRAKQVFAYAVKKRWLVASPFEDMKGWNEVNRKRSFVITREIADTILDAIPDAEFRLMFVFARFCGMRCPSEVRPFTWEQVNWDASTLLVRIPKTEHHEDHAERLTPIFANARPYLEELWDQTDQGEPLLFPHHQFTGAAITGKLERICRSLGIAMWPKPWVNMRSTCESELLNEYPLHTVAQWLGHSPTIALKHYAQIVKEREATAAADQLRILRSTPAPPEK